MKQNNAKAKAPQLDLFHNKTTLFTEVVGTCKALIEWLFDRQNVLQVSLAETRIKNDTINQSIKSLICCDKTKTVQLLTGDFVKLCPCELLEWVQSVVLFRIAVFEAFTKYLEPKLWLAAHVRLFLWCMHASVKVTDVPSHVLPKHNFWIHPNMTLWRMNDFVHLDFWCKSSTCINKSLLAKALPKRCQIRELGNCIVKYSESSILNWYELCCMFICGICGMYFVPTLPMHKPELLLEKDNMSRKLPFHVILHWMSTLIYNRADAIKWMTKSYFKSNQRQLLLNIRQCILYHVQNNPVIYRQILKIPVWNNFEKHTLYYVKNIADTWSSQPMLEYDNLFCHDKCNDVMKQIAELNAVLRQNVPTLLQIHTKLKTEETYHFTSIVLHCIKKAKTQLMDVYSSDSESNTLRQNAIKDWHNLNASCDGRTYCFDRLKVKLTDLQSYEMIENILCRCQTVISLGHQSDGVTSLIVEFAKSSIYDYVMFETEVVHLGMYSMCKIYPKNTVHSLNPPLTNTQLKSFHQDFVFVCIHCKQLKSAFCAKDIPCKAQLYRPCPTSIKTCVNDESMTLHCERGQELIINCQSEHDPLLENKLLKADNSDLRCCQETLLIVSLKNSVLQFNNALYTLCLRCGTCMQCSETSFRVCSWCRHEQQVEIKHNKMCALCGVRKSNSIGLPSCRWNPEFALIVLCYCDMCMDNYIGYTQKLVSFDTIKAKQSTRARQRMLNSIKK